MKWLMKNVIINFRLPTVQVPEEHPKQELGP